MMPKSYKGRKWMTVAGGFLLISSHYMAFTWGNLSIYVISYVLRHQSPTDYVISPWTSSIYLMSITLGLTICGLMVRFAGRRPVLVCSVIISNIGVLATYFSVQHSMEMVNFTLGFLHGFGNGLVNSLVLVYVADWTDNDEGVLIAISHCGCNAVGIFLNQILTLYINPHQQKPEAQVQAFKFFTQNDVVGKVPSTFLILGVFGVVVNTSGLVMVRENNASLTSTSNGNSSSQNVIEKKTDGLPREQNIVPSQNSTTDDDVNDDHNDDGDDVSPVQMVKTKVFYVVFYAMVATDVTSFVLLNYYKAYGQLHIQDDQFMAWIGTWMGVCVFLARLAWGRVIDRYGVKNCFIVLFSGSTVAFAFYFFTASINRWLYFASSLLISSCVTMFSFYSSALAKLFGTKHLGNNFGVLVFLAVGPLLALPPSLEQVIQSFGLFGLFAFPALTTAVALVLIVLFMP